ncbi:MAG: uracil phosphoribosyltransferase [Flavobacteriaceae bacterium]|nr:uracil phosphoribosyltransferase [Flavobacteriaceae bacterium]
MSWKGFFEGIQSLFVDVVFAPFDMLRSIAPESWFLSNIMSWILMAIGVVAFVYWMGQLKKFNDNNEEDRTSTGHTYL